MFFSVPSVLPAALVMVLVCLWPAPAAAQRAELARARSLYNQRQFDSVALIGQLKH